MFKILNEKCTPHRATKFSAYVDLFSNSEFTIDSLETKIIKLGVSICEDKLKENWIKKSGFVFEPLEAKQTLIEFGFNHFLKSHYLEVALRSSLGAKGLIISNGIGIIDLDFIDMEIGLIVTNTNNYPYFVHIGDKVAQCTLKEHKGYLLGYESEDIRFGGFGSSGDK